ncbi:tyrosine-type recombinase/integrase [Sphingomonas sp.]|uniref:tyrosine-type recombinase/integrase n=1 Tax=Sphingomonas sp. TaxID=28214 RepID=UPI00375138A6
MALKFNRLTRPAIRGMEPGQRINEHGVTVEKQANADVRYTVNVMVDGQRIHRVVGRESEGVTREQAERYIEKVRTEAREGRLDLPQGRKLHRSFEEGAEEYLRRLEASGGKDLINKRRHLRQHLIPYFGKTRLDKISEFELRKYRKQKSGDGMAHASINRHMATLLHMMNRAASKDWGWIKPEAKPGVPRVKEARKKINILSPEQADRLMSAATADQDGYIWLFVLFGLNTAMRHTEILERRFDEIDWDSCRIWIDKAKAGEREQPITSSLRDALLRQREMVDDQAGWIFPSRTASAKTPHRRSMAKQFIRIVERAGMIPAQCTPHIMRHTAITRLVKANVDLATIKAISGHKTLSMILHYSHVHGVHVDDAISVLDTGYSGAITPELHTSGKLVESSKLRVVPQLGAKSAA